MNQAYLNIKNINTLGDILNYVKSVKNPNDLIIFFDFDDTICDPDYDSVIEPTITRELFEYMTKHKIFFSIITGRFYNSACDDRIRNVKDMKDNILDSIYPPLKSLGLDVSKQEKDTTVYKIFNENNVCVGILFMGIFFTGKKGETIKNYIRMMNMSKKEILFIDDYEPYLVETTTSVPEIKAYRRLPPYANSIY